MLVRDSDELFSYPVFILQASIRNFSGRQPEEISYLSNGLKSSQALLTEHKVPVICFILVCLSDDDVLPNENPPQCI